MTGAREGVGEAALVSVCSMGLEAALVSVCSFGLEAASVSVFIGT